MSLGVGRGNSPFPLLKMAVPREGKNKLTVTMLFMLCCLLRFQPSWTYYEPEAVCKDIDIRNSVSNFWKLENCTMVEGYLQILLIDNGQAKDYDNMTFPKLREISGYLLLYRVFGLNSLSKLFPNLSVIRGNVLFHNYALVIFEMYQLQEVGLISLTDILRGSVRIEKNPSLCYVDTIDWDYIAKSGRGGHFIKENKNWEVCPNACPEGKACPQVGHMNGKTIQLCWNSNHCQKVCSDDCERQNQTCSTTSECCHPECLAGCRTLSSSDCIACRHVVYQGRCKKKCPPNTYEYLMHRCMEEYQCRNLSTEISWKPFLGQCLPECPPGYAEAKHDPHLCQKCTDRCPKVCEGVTVNNVAAAQLLRGCTYIDGSVAIEIKGGHNVIKELEENLKMIQEIRGYLKIARAQPLVSLDFFKELTVIHGQDPDKKNYSLMVLDNPNLQDLWDWKNRKVKLHLVGKVFFHFNSKLCPNKITDLKKYANVSDWDDRDVSPSSNGDRVACDVTNMNVTIPVISSSMVKVKWQNLQSFLHDSRSLLGYVIYYREAPYNNVSLFEGRDACGVDAWKVRDVELSNGSNDTYHYIYNLKPFTQYALYIRTYTTASGRQGAQSSIVYFKTKPDTPSQPLQMRAHSEVHNEIVVSWMEPKKPNGIIKNYIVEGLREIDSVDFINQRNYCLEPLSIPSYKKKEEDESFTKKIWTANGTASPPGQSKGECCSCNQDKTQLDADEEDAEYQIHFEDFLHNSVYVKNPDALQQKEHQRRSARSVLSSRSAASNSSKPIDKTLVDASDEVNTLIQFHRSVLSNFVVIRNLKHFAEYTIEVRACQAENSEKNSQPCSSKAITTVRTSPLGGADDIESSSVTVQTVNVTARSGIIRWAEPKQPNGMIVAYHIEYKRLSVDNHKPLQLCTTKIMYQQLEGFFLSELSPGNYSVRVRATSLAGPGNWTELVYFTIPVISGGWSTEAFVFTILATIIAAALLVASSYAVYKKYVQKLPENLIYTSVNPEYMSAGLVYEPDEWEVPRDKIKLLKELGQGSFGMVYKGELQNAKNGKLKIHCAAKTVNESATLRERIEFLQEASVMKAFNCHHVIKLLGVVSRGHPTLVIMELMENGDLKSWLRSRRPGSQEQLDYEPPTLQQMLQMAAEISDGMAYLGAKKFVHRDLAARNCMVAGDLTVKIGDFGMTRDIYETDYYRKGGKGLLPVRWMSPESLQDGIFDCQSDVWSFGVVLWEMATLASQPYQGLSNEQVLKYVIDGGQMDKPQDCPEKLHNIMTMCWDKNPKARPTFTEVVEMLLQDVNKKFCEVSFYFTEKSAACQETDINDAATQSTPLRSAPPQLDEYQPFVVGIHSVNNFRYFPSATQLPEEAPQADTDQNGRRQPAAEGSKGYSIHSNDSSKGMSFNYSDGSKGSKVSNISNGSLANGHVASSGRTAEC